MRYTRDSSALISHDVLPIVLAEQRDNGPARILDFCGTGFRVAADLLAKPSDGLEPSTPSSP